MQVTGNNIPSPHKSIRLCMDGLSFFQADAWKRIDTPMGKPNLERELAKFLCHPHSAANNDACTSILAEYPYTILLPQGFMNQEEALQAFRFHFPEANATQFVVMWQDLPTFPLTLVFAIPAHTYHLVQQSFTTVTWSHYLITHLEHCLKVSKQQGQKQVWIAAFEHFIHIALVQNGHLLFANHFSISSTIDVVYFCAQVYNQYDLSQQETPAYVLNDQEAFNSLQKHLTYCYFQPLYAHR